MAEAKGALALYFAHLAAELLRPRLPSGARVLDFGDRQGRVGEYLKAAGATIVREAEDPAGRKGDEAAPYHAAFAEVGDWALARAHARGLASRLASGAPLLIWLRRGPEQPWARVRDDLGPGFSWEHRGSLGLLVPGEAQSAWAERYPQLFGVLCALESGLRTWPLLRDAGREVLLLGTRREDAPVTRHGEAT